MKQNPEQNIRILIADDHAIVREGLKQVVAQSQEMQVAGEADSAAALFRLLEQEDWDIIILDINMPDRSGLDALKQIRLQYPDIPVLILSMYGEDQYGVRAIKAGAAGYLKKVSAPEELVRAIKKIVRGGRYISPYLAEKLADTLEAKNANARHETLSDREYQVLCQIALGQSAENIARSLSISVPTVYSYRNRIMEKLQLKSNVELTQYALQNHLIEL